MLYSKWMDTSLTTRHKIAEIFGFKKKRSTHVSNNRVVDDGFDVKEMEEAMTIHKLQDFLNNPETDLNKLFQLLVDVLEGKMPKVEIVPDISTGASFVPFVEEVLSSQVIPKKNIKSKKK